MNSFKEDISPKINENEANILVQKLYGIKCVKIHHLNGYDDKNFRIFCENCDGYVFKVLNKIDSKNLELVDAQNKMMVYLSDKNINCPYPIKNKLGDYFSVENLESGSHVVRLLKFLPGKIFYEMKMSDKNFFEAGKYIANIDKCLEDFHHPAYFKSSSLWKLESVPDLKQFMSILTDQQNKKMVENIIDEFQTNVLNVKCKFQHGFLHGDFNEQNILVEIKEDGDWSINGLLDFGDSHYSCLIFELAVAMTYMILQGKSLDVGSYFLAGYSNVRKIPDEEFEILKVCIAARFCQSLVLGLYFHSQHPENDYLLATQTTGWDILKKLWNEPKEKLYKNWKRML